MRVIIAALAAACFVSPAFASHHPADQVPAFIDAAAAAPYPTKAKVVVRERRHHRTVQHHVAKRESAHKTHAVAHETPSSVTVTASAPPTSTDYEDGIATPLPIVVTSNRPRRVEGTMKIADARFHFVSGGAGWSIPNGDYEISPDSTGDWGSRHGALDLTGTDRGVIHDPQLGRDREGIELHGGAHSTEGCVSIDQWSSAKRKIRAMIDRFGRAFLHVWPGAVTVTPMRSSGQVIVALHQSIAKDRVARAERRPHHQRRYARHRYRHYAHA